MASTRSEWTFSTGPRGLLLRVCEWRPTAPIVDAPPLVVLHGFLEQGAAWQHVAERLRRRVIAPDQRGHGRSGHVGAGGFYHFWDYVSDVDALVRHLGAPIDLLGHSMGGTVACYYAGTEPDAVRRLVLVEGLGPPDMTASAVDRARRFLADRRAPRAHSAMASVAEGVKRVQHYNPALTDEVALALVTRMSRPVPDGRLWTWDPLHRARAPVPFQVSIFNRFLDEITAPTLFVRGGTSWFKPADEDERFARLADARELVIPQAGHLVHHDQPQALADAIEAHLR